MQCTASDKNGLFECDHCFTEAMRRAKEQSPAGWAKWMEQESERCERIRAELEGVKNE